MSHTKGEWIPRKSPRDSDKWWDIPRPDSTSCIVTIWSTLDDEETIANAYLISAAPNMLKACEAWMKVESEMLSNNPCPDLALRAQYRKEAVALTKIAIAKAKKE